MGQGWSVDTVDKHGSNALLWAAGVCKCVCVIVCGRFLVYVCVRMGAHVCVRACVRVSVRVCVRVSTCECGCKVVSWREG